MKSVIFYTTQTSATDSMLRIITKVDRKKRKYIRFYDQIKHLPEAEIRKSLPPAEDYIALFNAPTLIDSEADLRAYKVIVNFRDPRDRICNVYYWHLVHPSGEPDSKRDARIERMKNIGINRWVLEAYKGDLVNSAYYKNILDLAERVKKATNGKILTYAKVCLDFDGFASQVAELLETDITPEISASLQNERIENIDSNAAWIGTQWAGADIKPGRYLRELDEEVIALLTCYYRQVLRRMAEIDDEYADLYLEGA